MTLPQNQGFHTPFGSRLEVGQFDFDNKDDRLHAAALLNFFGITLEWDCSTQDQMLLLGSPSKSSFYRMREFAEGKTQRPPKLSKDTLERISYIMGIYKALNILLPSQQRAAAWVNKPNQHPLFNGATAMDVMRQGKVIDLADIRRYLDAERGL